MAGDINFLPCQVTWLQRKKRRLTNYTEVYQREKVGLQRVLWAYKANKFPVSLIFMFEVPHQLMVWLNYII